MGYSKANSEQNTSEYVPIIQILFIFWTMLSLFISFFSFSFFLFSFGGRGRDLYLIGMTLEFRVQLRKYLTEMGKDTPVSSQVRQMWEVGNEMKWNEMKKRYTPKELQSIVIQPSRQQERQKIVKGKSNIDRNCASTGQAIIHQGVVSCARA